MSVSVSFPGITADNILPLVEAFLLEMSGEISATRLGVEARNDPNTVADLRLGREPRRVSIEKIIAAIEAHRPGFTSKFLDAEAAQ